MLTWNIWFDEHLQVERLAWLLEQVREWRPDILALQEVTHASQAVLEASGGLPDQGYVRVETGAEERCGYWESMYARVPFDPATSCRVDYRDTLMQRGVSVLHCPALELVVGTTHLESLHFSKHRQLQAEEALERLSSLGARNAVFLGDMNLMNGESLDAILPDGWEDVWSLLYPEEDGFTYDSSLNPMIFDGYRDRLDRVFVSCLDYTPKELQILGVSPRQLPDGTSFLPSDHFGLLLELVPKTNL